MDAWDDARIADAELRAAGVIDHDQPTEVSAMLANEWLYAPFTAYERALIRIDLGLDRSQRFHTCRRRRTGRGDGA